jgi:hypothetical protein
LSTILRRTNFNCWLGGLAETPNIFVTARNIASAYLNIERVPANSLYISNDTDFFIYKKKKHQTYL